MTSRAPAAPPVRTPDGARPPRPPRVPSGPPRVPAGPPAMPRAAETTARVRPLPPKRAVHSHRRRAPHAPLLPPGSVRARSHVPRRPPSPSMPPSSPPPCAVPRTATVRKPSPPKPWVRVRALMQVCGAPLAPRRLWPPPAWRWRLKMLTVHDPRWSRRSIGRRLGHRLERCPGAGPPGAWQQPLPASVAHLLRSSWPRLSAAPHLGRGRGAIPERRPDRLESAEVPQPLRPRRSPLTQAHGVPDYSVRRGPLPMTQQGVWPGWG